MQRPEYHSRFAVSQSAIKEFRYKSPKRWKDIWIDKQLDLTKNEEAFTFGSLVDTILFTPHLIDERFYIAETSRIPKGDVEKIIRHVYTTAVRPDAAEYKIDNDMLPESVVLERYPFEDLKSEILSACEHFDWNGRWKSDTKVNKIIEMGSEYYNLLAKAEGRKVITSELNFDALAVCNRLRQDESVGKYFSSKKNTRNKFQVELFDLYTIDNYQCPVKCAIDILHIDDKYKTLRVCDFKTSHSAHNFLQSIKQFGYCDQLSFYTAMVSKALEGEEFRDKYNIVGNDWKILEPINIVIDEIDKVPYIYEYSWRDIDFARFGNGAYFTSTYGINHPYKVKKGWEEVMAEIAWHLKNDKWDYPVEFYKTGKIKVNLTNS